MQKSYDTSLINVYCFMVAYIFVITSLPFVLIMKVVLAVIRSIAYQLSDVLIARDL